MTAPQQTAPATARPATMRCAVHPGRTRYDDCPVCARPRCVDDARQGGARGCAACIAASPVVTASTAELLTRAGLAAMPVALIGGWMAAQYVEDHLFSWVFPGLLGLAATWLAGLASYRRGLGSVPVTVTGAIAGLFATALGFRLWPHGPNEVLGTWSLVGLPYVATVIGAALWSVLLRPPNRSRDG